MRRHVVALALALVACQPAGTTETPGGRDTAALEAAEDGARPGTDEPAATQAAGPVEKGKPVPKVRDRDPEEEKKKMALSRQRSDEAAKHLAGGRYTDALDHARQALRIHEQNVDAMLVMAEVYQAQKKYELVQAVTSSALSVDAKIRTPQQTSQANNLKGFAYKAMGKDSLATSAFRTAAEADDKNASAWNNLGTRYMQAGDVATAKSCFQYAIELDAKFAKAHLNLGAALRAEGKLADAEKSLQTALKLRPNYAEAYFNLGVLYLDADPYPGLETTARLEKSITYLTRYRDLALADTPEGQGDSGAARGPKPGPALVSKARADDYIRVAKKGIEREQRKAEREKARATKKPEAGDAAAGGDAGGEPATSGDAATPAQPGGAPPPAQPGGARPPSQPGGAPPPSKPGGAMKPGQPGASKPADVAKPSGESPPPGDGDAPSESSPPDPSKPSTPAKPGATTPTTGQPTPRPPASKPAPSPPSTPAPSKPTAPSAPGGTPPASKPSAPAPDAPLNKPTAPPPAKPVTPQKPAAPAPGSPPSVQKPGAPKSAHLDLAGSRRGRGPSHDAIATAADARARASASQTHLAAVLRAFSGAPRSERTPVGTDTRTPSSSIALASRSTTDASTT